MTELEAYGFIPVMPPEDTNDKNILPARITAVHKERYELVSMYGKAYARLKTGVYYGCGYGGYGEHVEGNERNESFPTTGDFVLIQYNESGDSLIVKTLERKTYFSRLDPTPGRGEQAVAANFDYVFIMASLNFDFNLRRIERYITLTWQSGAVPVIILTKADLIPDYSEQVDEVEKIAAGVNIFAVSAKTGFGLDLLSEYLKPGKTIVLLGSSGVGKSSLINALAKEEVMFTNTIREDDSKGKHTTTHRQLIKLNNGVLIIDTPGMRELGMWDVSTGLGEAFTDVEEYFGKCKFSDCRHENEPGCAIKEAINSGGLSPGRWQNYLKLKREAKLADDKYGFLREKQARNKSISKHNKEKKKHGGFKK